MNFQDCFKDKIVVASSLGRCYCGYFLGYFAESDSVVLENVVSFSAGIKDIYDIETLRCISANFVGEIPAIAVKTCDWILVCDENARDKIIDLLDEKGTVVPFSQKDAELKRKYSI